MILVNGGGRRCVVMVVAGTMVVAYVVDVVGGECFRGREFEE